MNSKTRIVIFSTILLISIILKMKNISDEISSESYEKPPTSTESSIDVSKQNKDRDYNSPLNNRRERDKKIQDLNKSVEDYNETFKKFDTTLLNMLEGEGNLPQSGFSPYDSFFGSGKYNISTNNTIIVNTPENSHIVFLLKNVHTGKTIRNEFIRKDSQFSLTSIPYGTYEFSYFGGLGWYSEKIMNNGKIKGGFEYETYFSKSDNISDRIIFKTGYYGSYTLTLTAVAGGNLETENISEDEFFN